MRKWIGEFAIEALPSEIGEALRRRIRNVLERHGVSNAIIGSVVSDLFDQVSWAYVERKYKFVAEGPGRPVSAPASLLAVNVADLLQKHGVRGNWLQLVDEEEYGAMGPVAEIEAIAQTAFREVCGEQAAATARPARISKARKTLGKVHRKAS